MSDSSAMRAIFAPSNKPPRPCRISPVQAEQDRRWRRMLTPKKHKRDQIKAEGLPELFFRIATFAENQGITRHSVPRGCWNVIINAEWTLSLNLQETEQLNHKAIEIPPYAAYIEQNGTPLGIIGATGGALMVGAEIELMDALTNVMSLERK